MGMAEFHVGTDGGQIGPFGIEQLEEMARKGSLKPNTLVWADGMADWVAVSAVAELADVLVIAESTAAEAAAKKKAAKKCAPQSKEEWAKILQYVKYSTPETGFLGLGDTSKLEHKIAENIRQAWASGERSIHSLVDKAATGISGTQAAKLKNSLESYLTKLELEP
jgi:hypothetical protein